MKVTFVGITKEKEYPKEIDLSGFDEIIIKTESPNVYTRYLEAQKTKNEVIYVQDDDALVDYRELFKSYNGQITNGITPHHQNYYKGTGITLVGWGCFFSKNMLNVFDRYIAKYGEDFHLKREADRIFTYLNQPHNSVIMPHTDLPQVERMSHDPRHYEYIQEVLKKLHLIS